MSARRIHLKLEPGSMHGRGIATGVGRYARGRVDWSFHMVSRVAMNQGEDITPRTGDGLIGGGNARVLAGWSDRLLRRVVNVSRGHHLAGAANVTCDDEAIGKLAAEHLMSKPIEHLAFVGPTTSGLRYESFAKALRAANRDVTRLVTELDAVAMAPLLGELACPCGILCFNDLFATTVVRAAGTLGLRIPQDLAVVGVDNDTFAMIFCPIDVTSIDPDFERVGFEAARVLDGAFKGADPPDEAIRIPPRGLIERASTDFPGMDDELAVWAARLIRQRAFEGLTVAEVADALPTTYRTLDRRFQRAFGRTLHEEMTRVRIEEAKRLLRETRAPSIEVAERVGYGNAKHFSTTFRRHAGLSPSAYRREHRGRLR